jgi:hypothetical protein
MAVKQHIEGDKSIAVAGDYKPTFASEMQGITTDIEVYRDLFEYVLQKSVSSSRSTTSFEFLETSKKIELNFVDSSDCEHVQTFFSQTFDRISAIEAYFQTLDANQQLDITSQVYDSYVSHKTDGKGSMQILMALFEEYTPQDKRGDPAYHRAAKAFVLMFFEDCSIFEKKANLQVNDDSTD